MHFEQESKANMSSANMVAAIRKTKRHLYKNIQHEN